MRRYIFMWSLLVLTISGLSACTTAPLPQNEFPKLTYQHLTPLSLKASELTVQDLHKPSVTGRDVSLMFPTAPKVALRQWANDRLKPNGTPGHAIFQILEASAVEERLETKGGVSGFFTNDQSEKYTVRLTARLELRGPGNSFDGYAQATATRYQTLPEDSSLLDREKVWFNLVEKAMQDLNTSFEANIREQNLAQ